jgi:hypothetical protein
MYGSKNTPVIIDEYLHIPDLYSKIKNLSTNDIIECITNIYKKVTFNIIKELNESLHSKVMAIGYSKKIFSSTKKIVMINSDKFLSLLNKFSIAISQPTVDESVTKEFKQTELETITEELKQTELKLESVTEKLKQTNIKLESVLSNNEYVKSELRNSQIELYHVQVELNYTISDCEEIQYLNDKLSENNRIIDIKYQYEKELHALCIKYNNKMYGYDK